jgi:hypothetical protein
MTEDRLEKIYKILRILIYLIPAIAIIAGLYLVLFPIDRYSYLSDNSQLSKLEIAKDEAENTLKFGVFPLREHPIIDLKVDFKSTEKKSCFENTPKVMLEKTYEAFLKYPDGDPISDEKKLKEFLFLENNSKYPNGSLLHLKPTDEVFVISRGKRILFPGPEIFRAFGFSFENLTDVDKSTLDQFPEADQDVFLWTQPHPDGTIFQAFPSHRLFLIADGKKHLISDKNLLDSAWEENYSIPVSDENSDNRLVCAADMEDVTNKQINCRFDSRQLISSLGKYYYFTIKFPEKCAVSDVHLRNARIDFIAEKSYATVKDSLRNIFASVLNRYIYRKYN